MTIKLKQPQVGQLIFELRTALELTQEQFGSRVGVVFSTINRWENGHNQPSPLAMQKIESMTKELGDKGQELISRHLAKK